jgi:hypothetical protein
VFARWSANSAELSVIGRATGSERGRRVPACGTEIGIGEDELSSTVLAAGPRSVGDGLVDRLLRRRAETGQATSLRQLRVAVDGEGLRIVANVVARTGCAALADERR